MTEREMQELLWNHPEKLLNEPLSQFRWEASSSVGRADLIFTDRLGRLLIIEVKRGRLPRGAIDQLVDYFGMMKRQFPDKPVELLVVANTIPEERRLACEKYDIEPREIPEKRFRDVGLEVGYEFKSESIGQAAKAPVTTGPTVPVSVVGNARGVSQSRETAWYFWVDGDGKRFLLAFVNAKGSCSIRPFEAETGIAYKKPPNQRGDFQEAYRDVLKSALPLHIRPKVDLDKQCRERLPSPVLEELRRQIPKASR